MPLKSNPYCIFILYHIILIALCKRVCIVSCITCARPQGVELESIRGLAKTK